MNHWPYDFNGYCVYCRIAQYKPHEADCKYRLAIEEAQRKEQVAKESKPEAL